MIFRVPSLAIVTPPAAEPVSLSDAKAHCRVDHSADDALISAMIVAAREHCEAFTGRAFITQTWDLRVGGLGYALRIPKAPLSSVSSVKYLDANGVEQTADPSLYVVDAKPAPGLVTLASGKSWPTLRDVPYPVTLRFVAGYGASAANVPQAIRSAILLMVADLYDNRGSVIVGTVSSRIGITIELLLAPFRVVEVA